jgi:hypothetical protein
MKLRNEKEFSLQKTWQALQFRLVTQAEDEDVVISSVLELDVVQIQSIGRGNEEDPKSLRRKGW